ncbi:MAG: DNA repair protein RadC [Nitrospirae bacterium]|nr:DNA repair protein RadC [Nitrospirota bacterium]
MSYRIPMYKISMIRDGSVCAERKAIMSSRDVLPILREYFEHHDREEMLCLLLDAKHKLTGLHTISIGSLSSAIVHPRETFKCAIISNCAAIILAHNHPSGDPTPSQEDHALTKRLKDGGDILGIPVLDHLVIGENGRYVSFAETGQL